VAKPRIARDQEDLTGFVQGKPASDDEERFMRVVLGSKAVDGAYFRFILGARGMPGWLELDCLAKTRFGHRAFEVDDMTFVHKGQREREETQIKDIRRKNMLADLGIMVREIEHVDAKHLQSMSQARETVRRLSL